MKLNLISENETFLIQDFIENNLTKDNLYVLNTLISHKLSVPMMRNMLFQKQIFGFCSFNNSKIENIALLLYPSVFENTNFVQVLYLTLNSKEFFDEMINKTRCILDDDLKKIKIIINESEASKINNIENLGFFKEVDFDLGEDKRIHYAYFV